MSSTEELPRPTNLRTLPKQHAILLEVVQTLHNTLSEDPNIKFYVTGGAAFSYLVPEDKEPLNDIDCVCVVNTDLSPAAYEATQKKAIETTMNLISGMLKSVTAADLEGEIPAAAITKQPFRINHNFPTNYFPSEKVPKLSVESAFTGGIIQKKDIGAIVITVRQRTPPYRSLLDITFPMLDYDKDNYRIKWRTPYEVISIPGTSVSVPVITPDALRLNQRYAAKHAATKDNAARRTQRVKRLEEKFKLLPILEATYVSGVIPPPPPRRANGSAPTGGGGASAPVSAPIPAATGGAGTSTSAPAPSPPPVVIRLPLTFSIGVLRSPSPYAEHVSLFAEGVYYWPEKPPTPDGIYTFKLPFGQYSGKIGMYKLQVDRYGRVLLNMYGYPSYAPYTP